MDYQEITRADAIASNFYRLGFKCKNIEYLGGIHMIQGNMEDKVIGKMYYLL